MSRSSLAISALTFLLAAGPAAPQSLTTLLPSLSFPETVTPATKGCDPAATAPCPAED